jgi:hypothetical protein
VADGFTISVDSKALLAMMDRVGPSLDFHCRDVARETAKVIAARATARVRRRSSATASGIHWDLSKDGKGYVVLAYTAGKQAPVDRYLEYGTKYSLARPFWWTAALAEAGPHMQRLGQRIAEVLRDLGR